jgi:DinB superfamily
VNGNLAHLRACADVWGGYIAAILAEDHPTLRGRDPRTWIKRTDYPVLPFRTSLRAYRTQRAKLLAVLGPMPSEGWARGGNHRRWWTAGRTDRAGVAGPLAVHERVHLKQIERTVQAVRLSFM